MDEGNESSPTPVPESPKPLAFTIDFGENKVVDTQRQKALVEKLQKRHKRGQSLSKLENQTPASVPVKQLSLTGNLPRKSSFQSEGYFSSDEKVDRSKTSKRSDLTLLLKNVTSERMTQSFPNPALPSITSPEEIELKDVSSPELDLISPFSPREQPKTCSNSKLDVKKPQFSSPECEKLYIGEENKDNVFVDSAEVDFDKSDTVSDAGTYTLDADNYSEEQKARMSIDKEFRIEQVSVQKKTEEYVKSLSTMRASVLQSGLVIINKDVEASVTKGVQVLKLSDSNNCLKSPLSPTVRKFASPVCQPKPALSPVLSPTQNVSITQDENEEEDLDRTLNNGESDTHNKTFTKIMFPSPKAKRNGLERASDHGSVISVTSSGAFKPKNEKKYERKYSLSKSEVQVQAYIDGKSYTDGVETPVLETEILKRTKPKLTANIVNVQSIEVKKPVDSPPGIGIVSANVVFEKISNISPVLNCQAPTGVGGYSGKSSPTKIPSPIHTISRPRSRNSVNVEYSDSNLDTDLILKPTQNYINSLQQRLSLDSDPDSDYDSKYGIQLNNTAHLLKQKASHTRHNSLDDRAMNISNKLEHFQNKNLQGIDQTYTNLFNQYAQNKVIHKIQNSPNNSPIKRSSSFSTKNQINPPKNTNLVQKESNICNSPNLTRNSSIQRSSSTACIKPNYISNRRQSIGDQRASQYGDTESSSEEDLEKNLQKRKDLANITNTRCNRAFSLRRARIDNEPSPLKCPNTPEMRRKNLHLDIKQERAISVDRKPMKTNDVQSRYLLNITKQRGTPPPPSSKPEVKSVPKVGGGAAKTLTIPNKPQVFSRTDSGRFSMRTSKPPPANSATKGLRKDGSGKKQGGGRSNSSLSSREVEFQNWKRRKSYDPMKAAAEGKKKELAKRQGGVMAQSYIESSNNHSQDSSPSHSSSVHRSQSFHGTAALEQLVSSDEEDLTLSADEGFSPPTPSPCELSPARASLRHALWERIRH